MAVLGQEVGVGVVYIVVVWNTNNVLCILSRIRIGVYLFCEGLAIYKRTRQLLGDSERIYIHSCRLCAGVCSKRGELE